MWYENGIAQKKKERSSTSQVVAYYAAIDTTFFIGLAGVMGKFFALSLDLGWNLISNEAQLVHKFRQTANVLLAYTN